MPCSAFGRRLICLRATALKLVVPGCRWLEDQYCQVSIHIGGIPHLAGDLETLRACFVEGTWRFVEGSEGGFVSTTSVTKSIVRIRANDCRVLCRAPAET
jgi:hypothetical protein